MRKERGDFKMKYEYLEGRHVSTSNDNSKWLRCFECNKSCKNAKATKCNKIICLSCYFKDHKMGS